MKRKIIFSGCSFTWGQSLWAYEDIPNLPNAYEWTQLNQEISEDILETRKKYRFPNLVCNELGNYEEIVKLKNGGTDEESVNFIDFHMGEINNLAPEVYGKTKTPELIDAIVFQTTQIYRSPFDFTYKDNLYSLYSTPDRKNLTHVNKWEINKGAKHSPIDASIDIFYDYCIDNNIKPDDFEEIHSNFWASKIKKVLKKYHDKGIKVFLLSWTDEYLDKIKEDEFLSSIFVPLYYKDKKFECIDYLYRFDEEMKIDKHIKNRDMGFDEHPSSNCHQVIANSIIKKWNEKKV